MKFYIGNTDFEWYSNVKNSQSEVINFWRPGGHQTFRVIQPGDVFLFRLNKRHGAIAGAAVFAKFESQTIEEAWQKYGIGNGQHSLDAFARKIDDYRNKTDAKQQYKQPDKVSVPNPNIGCVILNNPVFFDEPNWLDSPADWDGHCVQGRSYDSNDSTGNVIWNNLIRVFEKEGKADSLDTISRTAAKTL